ncbi:uncharacterized protein LOC129298454 isoform X2 [Prosopis cineraria]|uniref:uncharacterized protein LOC129298454 isoform X2 n=1 Tax=Prosopis cineraria TaxID=364024 RepID=UPI00241066AE|nr:uncharacterized protein LOC129298454 isoform X2 [Prosopis cineraria]
MSPSLSASTLNSPPPSNSAPSPPSSVSWNSCLVQKLNGMLDLPFRSAFSGPPWSLSGLIGFLLAAPLGGLKALIFFCFGLGEWNLLGRKGICWLVFQGMGSLIESESNILYVTEDFSCPFG